ncbi:hypothetical protein ACSBR1_026650 [Camellia fascicularis]
MEVNLVELALFNRKCKTCSVPSADRWCFVRRTAVAATKAQPVFSKPPPPSPSPSPPIDTPPIRWRKGELIGFGAFGRVYMWMNLDSGELLAVKQAKYIDGNSNQRPNLRPGSKCSL